MVRGSGAPLSSPRNDCLERGGGRAQIREALSDKARSLFLLSPTAYQEEEEEEEAETTLVVVVLVLV